MYIPAAAMAYKSSRIQHDHGHSDKEIRAEDVVKRAERAAAWGRNQRQGDWQDLLSDLAPETSLRLLDFLAVERVPPQQFVDDTVALASCLTMLRNTNRALSRFVAKWRHAYQGGAKAPRMMAVTAAQPSQGEAGELGGHLVQVGQQLKLLGHWIDAELSFRQQTQVVLSKLRVTGREIATTMSDAGFGCPLWQRSIRLVLRANH